MISINTNFTYHWVIEWNRNIQLYELLFKPFNFLLHLKDFEITYDDEKNSNGTNYLYKKKFNSKHDNLQALIDSPHYSHHRTTCRLFTARTKNPGKRPFSVFTTNTILTSALKLELIVPTANLWRRSHLICAAIKEITLLFKFRSCVRER